MTPPIDLTRLARDIRLSALELCFRKRTSHIGGSLSVADLIAVLYGAVLNLSPDAPAAAARDRLFYSKGHACAALYAALHIRGFFGPIDLAELFTADGSYFTSHINHRLPGVELSTGSLGHALGVACGVAIAGQRRAAPYTVFALLSDGELDEGSNWEAILFAGHHRLDNLVAIVDYNKIQSFGTVASVMDLDPLPDKLRAFNWDTEEVDGHNLTDLLRVLSAAKTRRSGRPKCVIAHTTKGKGVSFMENLLAWHYRSPDEEQYQAARRELETGHA